MDTRQRYGEGDFVKKIEDLMAARKEEYQKSAQPTAGELALAVASAIGKKPGGNIGEIAGELSQSLMPLYLKKKEAKAKIAGQDIEDLISVEKIKAYKAAAALKAKEEKAKQKMVDKEQLNQLDPVAGKAFRFEPRVSDEQVTRGRMGAAHRSAGRQWRKSVSDLPVDAMRASFT